MPRHHASRMISLRRLGASVTRDRETRPGFPLVGRPLQLLNQDIDLAKAQCNSQRFAVQFHPAYIQTRHRQTTRPDHSPLRCHRT
jgi:hypothetical protein